MKKLILIVSSLMIASFSFSQTQQEMNIDAEKSFEKKDKELNEVYQKILVRYKEDSLFIKNLKIAQRLWVQFRDAQMDMKFPEKDPRYYGTIYPLCWYSYKEELTDDRITVLKEWVDGVKEHGCDGSIQEN